MSVVVAAAASFVIALTPAACRPAAAKASEPTPFGQLIGFNIPAEPLDAAIAAYAAQSGVDILYVEGLTGERRSAPVVGDFTEATALETLLQGSGLTARFPKRKAAIIYVIGHAPPLSARTPLPSLQLDMAQVIAPIRIGGQDPAMLDAYARTAGEEIGRLISADPVCRAARFHIVVAVLVNGAGRIQAIDLMQGSGNALQDDRIRRALTGKTLPPPPAILTQALKFDIDRTHGAGSG